MEQIVDNPVPRGGGRRLQGFLPEQSTTALTVEQNVDIPVPHESLQDFRAGQSSASSSHSPARVADDAFEGFFFALFPRFKKVRHYLRALGRQCLCTQAHGRRQLMTCRWCSREEEEEEESEEELDYDVDYMEFDGRWWGCEWVPARQQQCWCLAAADGSQIGHTIWQPP